MSESVGAAFASRLGTGRDPRLLEDLYDAYGVMCYRLARHIVVDAHLAHDVVQEVFLAVWARPGAFDSAKGSVRTWLLQVTHHKAVDAVRRNQRHSGRAATTDAITLVAAADDVEHEGWLRARRTHVHAALTGLSEKQRQVLVLAYFGGYTQSEIAEITSTPLGTVKTRTLAALRQLRAADVLVVGCDEATTPRTKLEGGAPGSLVGKV